MIRNHIKWAREQSGLYYGSVYTIWRGDDGEWTLERGYRQIGSFGTLAEAKKRATVDLLHYPLEPIARNA